MKVMCLIAIFCILSLLSIIPTDEYYCKGILTNLVFPCTEISRKNK